MFRFTSLATAAVVALLGAAVPAGAQERSAGQARTAEQAPLDLNTATQAQLEALPGVGAATAKSIIEYRQKNGGFKKIEELMNIKGVGEKSFLKLKPLITVGAQKDKAGALH